MTASKRTLYIDPSFDAGVYAGGETSSVGVLRVGLTGALGTFEAQVGSTQSALRSGVRVGQALNALAARQGFWSASLAVDGLATATELLRWFDTLRMEGWQGEGGERLSALWSTLRPAVAPGVAERLEVLATRLPTLSEVAFDVRLFRPTSAFPARWRALWAQLGATTMATGARDTCRPTLIRPHGPLVAAQGVAHAVAMTPTVPTLIVGADAVLDAAFVRAGLPSLGAARTSHDNAWGEVLPLVVELGLRPANPERVLELLSIRGGPVPAALSRALLQALHHDPAVGSTGWNEAFAEHLPLLDPAQRERVSQLFTPEVEVGAPWPVDRLVARATVLQRWVHGRLHNDPNATSVDALRAVSSQLALFTRLLQQGTAPTLSMTQVRRFLELAHGAVASPRGPQRQAGIFTVGEAGGVVAPIERIIWWNYVRSSAPPPRGLPLTDAERVALTRAGVHVPGVTVLAQRRAHEAQRPFSWATQALWLIAPRHEENGDKASPHPSWDQLVAHGDAPAAIDAPPVPLKTRASRQLVLPSPRLEWQHDAPVPPREQESPSSIEAALGCSLQWTLRYPGRLRSGLLGALPDGDQRAGSLTHRVLLDHVLKATHATADDAARYAARVFDEQGPLMAAALFLPGATAERDRARLVMQDSARALFELTERGWSVVDTEVELTGRAFKTAFGGSADLILKKGKRRAIVDLKWSGHGYRRNSLQTGTAMQLASYAALLEQQGFAPPSVGYFILTTGTMLSADKDLAVQGTALRPDADARETWAAMEKAHSVVRKQLKKGALRAPGVIAKSEKQRTELGEDGLHVQTPCHFCEFEGLCGRRYGQLEATDDAED